MMMKALANGYWEKQYYHLEDNNSYNFEVGEEIYYSDLKVGERYLITFPNDNIAVVELKRILKNSLGDNYNILNIRGAEKLTEAGAYGDNIASDEFPLPELLFKVTKFNILKFY